MPWFCYYISGALHSTASQTRRAELGTNASESILTPIILLHWYRLFQYIVQHSTVQYNAMQYSTVQHNTAQYNVIQYSNLLYIKKAVTIVPANQDASLSLFKSVKKSGQIRPHSKQLWLG